MSKIVVHLYKGGGVRFAGGRHMGFLVADNRYIVRNCPGCRDLIGCPVPGNNKYTSEMPGSVKFLPGRRYSLKIFLFLASTFLHQIVCYERIFLLLS